MLWTVRSWSFILKEEPGPSTLVHGFADVEDAGSMCLKMVVVMFARCCCGSRAVVAGGLYVRVRMRVDAWDRDSIDGFKSVRGEST